MFRSEADDAKRIEHELRIRWDREVRARDSCSKARPDHYAQPDQHCCCDKCSDLKQMTPKELSTNFGFAGIAKSARVIVVPKRDQITTPSPISTAAAINVQI